MSICICLPKNVEILIGAAPQIHFKSIPGGGGGGGGGSKFNSVW